jgi:hypothetical protein
VGAAIKTVVSATAVNAIVKNCLDFMSIAISCLNFESIHRPLVALINDVVAFADVTAITQMHFWLGTFTLGEQSIGTIALPIRRAQ